MAVGKVDRPAPAAQDARVSEDQRRARAQKADQEKSRAQETAAQTQQKAARRGETDVTA